MNWTVLLFIIGGALIVWLAVRIIKNNPGSFTKENFGKTAQTLGFLALALIFIIGFCILLLRN